MTVLSSAHFGDIDSDFWADRYRSHAPWSYASALIFVAMRKRPIAGSRTAVWRFFQRHNISVKKMAAGGGARASRRGPRRAALDATARYV